MLVHNSVKQNLKDTILIVEDEAIVAESLQRKLEKMGYTVTDVCASGGEALESIESLHPGLILMDIKLEGNVDGIETAHSIGDKYDLPIVYLTAYADEPTLQRAKLTEPYGYVLKPFTDRELRSNIEIAFYKYQMEKELKESEKRLRKIVQEMRNGLLVVDNNWKISFANEHFLEITGYTQEEIYNQDVRVLLDQSNVETVSKLWQDQTIVGERSFELDLSRKELTAARVLVSPKLYRGSNGDFQGCIFTVTELHEKPSGPSNHIDVIPESLRQDIENNVYSALLIQFHDWNIVEVNDAFVEASGFTREELIDQSAIRFVNWKKIEDMNLFLALLNNGEDVDDRPVKLRIKDDELKKFHAAKYSIEKNGALFSLLVLRSRQ
jgi:PAS domain S-box-containing protein